MAKHYPKQPVAPNVEDPPCERCGGDPASCACFTEHTPTPWLVEDERFVRYRPTRGQLIWRGDRWARGDKEKRTIEYPICETPTKDDAAFIVRACNAHEALLEAAKRAGEYWADGHDRDEINAQIALDKAIALAEGGKESTKCPK